MHRIPVALALAGPVLDRTKTQAHTELAHRESSVPFSHVAGGRPLGSAVDLCPRLAEAVRSGLGMATSEVAFTVPCPVRERRDLQGQMRVSTRGTTPLKAVEQANTQGLPGLAAGRPDPKAFRAVGKYLTIVPMAIHDRWQMQMRPIPPARSA